MNYDELWHNALAEIKDTTTKANFITWFKQTAIADLKDGIITLSVPNGFAREWLRSKYHKSILRAVRNLNSDVKEVEYVIGKYQPVEEIKKRQPVAKAPDTPLIISEEETPARDFSVDPETNLNPRYTFDTFIVGSFNELAHATGLSIVKSPGTSYNPLFVYGGVGLGKTHLIQAIGNEMVRQYPEKKVRYVPAERFMGEIVEALKNQEMGKLKEKYRPIDLLIMDDIQFIARTEKMQEEFFHIFNTLYERNKQILISSDRPPKSIPTLEERLRSRFEGGMIADIGLPDRETRMTILKTKADQKEISVPEDVLWFIADSIKTNIRELEGALNRVIVSSKISNRSITIDEVRKILSYVSQEPRRFTSVKKVLKVVSDFYDIDERELINHSRRKEVVKPRQIAMFLLREEMRSSFPFIGEKLGKKDHTTVIHACKKITNDLKNNPILENELSMIKEKIYEA